MHSIQSKSMGRIHRGEFKNHILLKMIDEIEFRQNE